MADRYWVGGTGTWNTTSTTNWSATSGGPGGASVPTAADSVFFDQAGTYTVTLTGALACLDLTISAGTVTTTSNGTIAISGSMSLIAGTIWNGTGTLTFNATTTGRTVTTNGVSMSCPMAFNGSGGEWTLGSALTLNNTSFSVLTGTFNTANYNISASAFSSSASSVRTVNLGSSTITLSSSTAFSAATITNLTFNAGTSTIICTSSSLTITFASGGLTFYNLSFTGTSSGTVTITGANTFNDLSITGPTTAGVKRLSASNITTINGTFSANGTAPNQRVTFVSTIGSTVFFNSAPNITDVDFDSVYAAGTAAPISGTRIGNRGNCRNITFDAPKTVYWNLSGVQGWTSNAWASSSGGTPNINNFPLPQDTAVIDDAGAATNIQLSTAIGYVPTVDMSGRTIPVTINLNANVCYGHWINGPGVTLTGTGTLGFSNENTKTITSAGKTFPSQINISSYGGVVELNDALTTTSSISVLRGRFKTNGYAVTAVALSSSGSDPKAIYLGNSTLNLSGATSINMVGVTNLTFDAGTSQINLSDPNSSIAVSGVTFYNVSFTTNSGSGVVFRPGPGNTFNNLTVAANTNNTTLISFTGNITVNGTFTCSGSNIGLRTRLSTDEPGTTRTLTINNLVADNCDFSYINIAGAAINSSPANAGNCAGNSGIIFPAPKTVYWNLAGSQNWNSIGWASSSGGTPDINNFPLAQDTAIFDDSGAAGTITLNLVYNLSAVNMSARTSAMTLSFATSQLIYGDFINGSGTTLSGSQSLTFASTGTQTIISAGKTSSLQYVIYNVSGKTQLGDALSTSGLFDLNGGEFDAVSYNVTAARFSSVSGGTTLRMGSGTWTLTSTGTVWDFTTPPTFFYKGTANIVLSNTSTSARTFAGGSRAYNKLTIGGTTGTSTLTISGTNQFTELASTKTVAHTISFTTMTVGAWTVTGTAGNLVTVTGTTLTVAGARVSGVDYLTLGTTALSTTSPGEFYAGANSTGSSATIIKTAAPAPTTRYWVGGTGTWNTTSTTNWSASSGGPGGASVPTSADAVIFNSASNATAYTVTCASFVRCGSLTVTGPASGNLTWSFSGATLVLHDNCSFTSTGITYSAGPSHVLSGSATGKTFNLGTTRTISTFTINGIGCGWTLQSSISLNTGSFNILNGSFNTGNNNITNSSGLTTSSNSSDRTLTFGTSTFSLTEPVSSWNISNSINFTLNAGSSTITMSNITPTFNGGGLTYNSLSFTSVSNSTVTVSGNNTFNGTLSFNGRNSGVLVVTISNNMTINSLALNGSSGSNRVLLQSSTTFSPVTLTCTSATLTDADFRDITIAGTAAPATGTRLGNCEGNSGITFDAPKTVYWNLAAGGNMASAAWALSPGGTPSTTNLPLAQDTMVFENAGLNSGAVFTIGDIFNIGTIDMANRTNAMTVTNSSSGGFSVYGDWINGSGTSLTSTGGSIAFRGENLQTITSSGKSFASPISILTLSGTVELADAFTTTSTIGVNPGTFKTNGYTVSAVSMNVSGSTPRVLDLGTSTILLSGTSGTVFTGSSSLTVNATSAIIRFTGNGSRTFSGNSANYSNVTLDNAGSGTLTISGTNIFGNISNSYNTTGAATISNIGTQTVSNFTATGSPGNALTLSGLTGNYRYTGFYPLQNLSNLITQGFFYGPNLETSNYWYGGTSSTATGSIGWMFETAPVSPIGNFFFFFNNVIQ